jgi:DNA-binding NarL/FixJ family response regulator
MAGGGDAGSPTSPEVVYDQRVKRVLVVAVPDLLFQSRIEAAARARGLDVRACASDADAAEALAAGPAGLVVDLQAAGIAPLRLVAEARAAGLAVLAFGRHTDAAALRAAREAGAAAAVPRSEMAERLPELLDLLLRDVKQGVRDG